MVINGYELLKMKITENLENEEKWNIDNQNMQDISTSD